MSSQNFVVSLLFLGLFSLYFPLFPYHFLWHGEASFLTIADPLVSFELEVTSICLDKLPSFLSFVGFEVYLVGGCVRDLILQRIPKDFDIITSAELKEVILDIISIFLHIAGRNFDSSDLLHIAGR